MRSFPPGESEGARGAGVSDRIGGRGPGAV